MSNCASCNMYINETARYCNRCIGKMRLKKNPEIKNYTIEVTNSLFQYLQDNHAGQRDPKYAVLSRIVAGMRTDGYIETIIISEEEWNSIPDEYMNVVSESPDFDLYD